MVEWPQLRDVFRSLSVMQRILWIFGVGVPALLAGWWLRRAPFGTTSPTALGILTWGMSPEDILRAYPDWQLLDYELYRAQVDYDSRFDPPVVSGSDGSERLYVQGHWLYGRWCDFELGFFEEKLVGVCVALGFTDDETEKVVSRIRADLSKNYIAAGARQVNERVTYEFTAKDTRAELDVDAASPVRRGVRIHLKRSSVGDATGTTRTY
jgi:hypothetical protein